MPVTANMIISGLAEGEVLNVPADPSALYAFAFAISEDDPATVSGFLGEGTGYEAALAELGVPEEELLLVGGSGACAVFLRDHPTAHMLCVQAEAEIPAPLEAHTERLLVVRTERSVQEFFVGVRLQFYRVSRWIQQMQNALLKEGGYQELLDLSVPMLGRFIVLTDSAQFRPLAWTSSITTDDPRTAEAISRGSYGRQAVDEFRKEGVHARWLAQKGIGVQTVAGGKLTICDYVFRIDGVASMVLAAHFDAQPSPGEIDLLRMLIDHMEMRVQLDSHLRTTFNRGPARALVDLARGRSVSERAVGDLLPSVVSPDTTYTAYVVDFGYRDEEELLAVYAGNRFLENLPGVLAGLVGSRLLLVQPGAARDHAEFVGTLAALLEKGGGFAGYSDPIADLFDMQFAYRQAAVAAKTGSHLAASPVADTLDLPRGYVFAFTDMWSHYLLSDDHDRGLIAYCLEHSVLARIVRDDQRHGSNDFKLLYTYLVEESRLASVARVMGIHRNTAEYRIERLERLHHLDLSDSAVRSRLTSEYGLMLTRFSEQDREASA